MGFQRAAIVKQKLGVEITTRSLPGLLLSNQYASFNIVAHPGNCHSMYIYQVISNEKTHLNKLIRKALQIALVDEFAYVQVCLNNSELYGRIFKECGFKPLGKPYYNYRYLKMKERNSYITANPTNPNDTHWITTLIANVDEACEMLNITEDKVE